MGTKEGDEFLEFILLCSRVSFIIIRSLVIIYKLIKRDQNEKTSKIPDFELKDSNLQES